MKYATSILATATKGSFVCNSHSVLIVVAANERKAGRIAMSIAKKIYPTRLGWKDHNIGVAQIDDESYIVSSADECQVIHKPVFQRDK